MTDDGDVGAADSSPTAGAGEGSAPAGDGGEGGAGWAGTTGRRERLWGTLAARLGLETWTVRAVAAVAAVGLLARLAWLGSRAAHYDEGRVAYWSLRYARSGHFEYRAIIHGPFVQHVDRWLFAVVGPSDLVARLPVALVGAALPLVALWYRDHLEDVEVVGVAGLLALNPILLYYSRFLRSDLLVATFMFAALGALLRLRSTRRPGYLYAAAALVALGAASKENAVLYVLCWLGAAALLAEVALFRPRDHATGRDLLRAKVAAVRGAARDHPAPGWLAVRAGAHLLGALALFSLVTLFMFAPRAGTVGGPGLWAALADPTQLPNLVAVTARDIVWGYGSWFGGAADPGCRKETLPEGYGCYLWRMTVTVGLFATATAVLAAVGFLRERYATADSRPLVMFATFWGVASFLGYPLGTDIWSAWIVAHVVVPLTIPAAAGLRALLGVAGDGLAADRQGRVAVPLAILLVLGGWTGAVAVDTAFVDAHSRSHSADMVQYAQPQEGLRPAVDAMRAAVAGHDGDTDVVYYGARFDVHDESAADQPPVPPEASNWFDRLPLPWYTEATDASVRSLRFENRLAEVLEERPPVIIADAGEAGTVERHVEGYRTFRFDLRAHTDGPGESTSVVVFVDERRLDGDG